MKRVVPADLPHTHPGFTMVETLLAILLVGFIAGFAMISFTGIKSGMQTNAAMNQTVAQLRRGRELAIAQRRSVEVRFLDVNEIQLLRYDVPAGTTVLSDITLDNKVGFRLFDGIPDSPDSFGNDAAVDFGGGSPLIFQTDGTLVDAQGNPLNGSIFLGLAGHPETARVVSVLGATGRVRGYRWTGTAWIQ